METNTAIKIFEERKVRTLWNEDEEECYFSVLDVIAVLTNQPDYTKVRNYWKWLKGKLAAEGSELVSNTNQLKLPATDGKFYRTDVASTAQVFRLIQSIPSPKAEPFKQWLAQVAKECLDQHADVARRGGNIAKEARLKLEAETGKKVVSPISAKRLLAAGVVGRVIKRK